MTTTEKGEFELKFDTYAKIAKPVSEVFEAVVDPKKLSGYFTTGGAKGRLEEGATVTWDFHDFPGAFPVHVKKVEPNKRIELEWQAADGDYNTRVRMEFESLGPDKSLVRISESGWRSTPKALESAFGNCRGWSQMVLALKVYVEQGINLRSFLY